MKKYIFLDFDGVLNIPGKPSFYRAEFFAQTIQVFDNVEIIFSTSWREHSSVPFLTSLMPSNIRHKITGKTPVIKDYVAHVRHKEILQYLEENNIQDEQWVAIDDMQSLFPKNCKNLILTDPKVGFYHREAKLLKDFYENNFF